MKKRVQLLTVFVFLVGFGGLVLAGSEAAAKLNDQPGVEQQKPANPCNPCAKGTEQNPCNPCAKKKAQNPCNPCAKKAQNPCNPCAAKKASEEVYQPAVAHRGWTKINSKPILSEAHGGMLVTTYANTAAQAAVESKAGSFPVGAILVKESHANSNGKPGAKGTVFAMEKTAAGWLWVTTDATGHVTGKGDSGQMQMCASCHASATVDSAFLRTK
ncbi:MAG TPA: cytochrome P460 family protein [Blastocatellia bacterium]|nr:cytochrome P460 family protein [Blastocatellia bacterium]